MLIGSNIKWNFLKVKKSKMKSDFLGNNAASDIEKVPKILLFLKTVPKIVWIQNGNRNFSKVGTGTAVNHKGSTTLVAWLCSVSWNRGGVPGTAGGQRPDGQHGGRSGAHQPASGCPGNTLDKISVADPGPNPDPADPRVFGPPWIRIHRIHVFLGLHGSVSTGSTCFWASMDPDPDPLVRDMDPDPFIMKQK
jgi:hypothetical protein